MSKILNYLNVKVKTATGVLAKREIFVSLVIILVAFAGFGLGRLSVIDNNRRPITVGSMPQISPEIDKTSTLAAVAQGYDSGYVASKNGTKYYLPECASAKRISEQNRIWFKTKEEAETAGYGPAANCPEM